MHFAHLQLDRRHALLPHICLTAFCFLLGTHICTLHLASRLVYSMCGHKLQTLNLASSWPPTPTNLCTGTCTPNLISPGHNLRLQTTPSTPVLNFWRRLPNDIRAKCGVEGLLVRPPNETMGLERGAVCVCVRVGACVCGHLSSNRFKQVVYY